MIVAGSVVAHRLAGGPVIEDVLLGRLPHAAVREVVVHPGAAGLGEVGDHALADDARLEPVRTKFKPGRKLTASYQLLEPGRRPLPLVVTWSLAGGGDGVDVSVLTYPHDPSMPQLSCLGPRHLRESIAELGGPTPPGAEVEVDVIRYRPGQRHVLRIRACPEDPAVFVKVDRDDSGRRSVPVAHSLDQALAAAGTGRAAEPLGYHREDGAAYWRAAHGTPLSVMVRGDAGSGRATVARAGAALRTVHDFEPAPDAVPAWWPGLPAADHTTEVRDTLRAAEHIRALRPATGRRHADAVGQVASALESREAEPAVLSHGDYKGDNLLAHQGQVRLLDLDRVRLAEPAMDLGKLLADLRWWCRGDAGRERQLATALCAGYGPCPPLRWSRARLFATLYGLRAVARRVPLHTAAWAAQVDRSTDVAVLPFAEDER